ncbi:glycosyltransferase [Novosphingobium pentaromativorans]|nr:glycosyltransferase [Novosphingobium pentaromativorans]AIT79720.1 glycosyl transferase family 1 [Novosphingobium pentaromativorans US6-1]
MTRPRIAYVINSLEGGGAALPVPAVARVLRENGADVRVFALLRRDGRALPPMLEAGLDPAIREGSAGDHLAAARWLRREVKEWGATHLWTSLSRATILGLLLGPVIGLPVIAWQHNAFLKPWNRRLLRALQSRAQVWVADSRSVADLSVERLGVTPERLATWPIYFADEAMPQAPAWSPGQPLRLGSLGRLHPAKGYDVLIGALARLRNEGFAAPVPFTIEIAGEGSQRARLEELAKQAGLDVLSLAGYTDAPYGFLSGLNLYLQPSRAEGFCIAAHEAMTAGLPVIGSRVGEMPYSIRPGETGWLVDPGDVASLGDALSFALSEPGRLASIGAAARDTMYTRFSWDSFSMIGREIMARIGKT